MRQEGIVTHQGSIVTHQGTILSRQGSILSPQGSILTREESIPMRQEGILMPQERILTPEEARVTRRASIRALHRASRGLGLAFGDGAGQASSRVLARGATPLPRQAGGAAQAPGGSSLGRSSLGGRLAGAVSVACARRLARDVALLLQAVLPRPHSTDAVFEAFCASRLAGSGAGDVFGLLPAGVDTAAIVARAASGASG